MANEFEARWKHTTNDRFKVSLPIADCFMWSFMQHSQNLHTFCIYEVRGGARSGQSAPEMFQQEASERQLCQRAENTF